jgi:hypothetical protein
VWGAYAARLMRAPSSLPLLQPVSADTPLAALLNRWLLALAPVAALINPEGAHFLHAAVSKSLARLEAGKDLGSLREYNCYKPIKRGFARPLREKQLALALAARASELPTAKEVHLLGSYSYEYLDKLLALPTPFAADRVALDQILGSAGRVSFELDWAQEVGRGEEQVRADVLDALRYLVTADVAALAAHWVAVESRYHSLV